MELPLEKVREAIVLIISLVISIAVHEFGHAFAADKLGDSTPRLQGRVTLNPIVHADPIGTLALPLFLVLLSPGGFFFGWGRPVQINPMAFTRKLRMKTGHLIVALAGPAMNVVLALIITVLWSILLKFDVLQFREPLEAGIRQVIMLNWVLCFFNLIPVPPLDGGAVLAGLLPDRHAKVLDFLSQYGLFILIGLMVTRAVEVFLWPAQRIYILTIELALRAVL